MRRLGRGLKELNAQLVLVSLDKDAVTSDSALRHFGVTGPTLIPLVLEADDPQPITARFSAKWRAELPATFIVLESGQVVASHLGTTPVERILEEVRDQIQAPDAGTAFPARRTK